MKLSVDDVQVMNLIGDVEGKVAIMVDDMIDTAGMVSSHGPRTLEMWFINFAGMNYIMHLLIPTWCVSHRYYYKQRSTSTCRRSSRGVCLLHTCSF